MRLIDADELTNEVIHDMAIAALHSNAKYFSIVNDIVLAFSETIDNVPTIDAEPVKHREWVQCSERLPNEEGEYMVTLKMFSDDDGFIDLLYYGEPLMPNCKVKGACWYRSVSEWGDVVYDDTDILAWMPLPKPYR